MKAVSPLTSGLEEFKQKDNSARSSPFKWLKAVDILHIYSRFQRAARRRLLKAPPQLGALPALTAPFAGALAQRLRLNSSDVMSLKSEQNQN